MTNEVLETIKKRRSERVYKPDAVPQELLDAVLEAGTYAPTGRGQQSPVIIAVCAAEYRKKINLQGVCFERLQHIGADRREIRRSRA